LSSSNNATVSARASSSTSDAALLLLRFEAPAPDRCKAPRADNGLPPLTDRCRATPFVVAADEGVGERAGPLAGDAGANAGSVEDLRAPAAPAGGFFVAVDIVYVVLLG
jgi:hypothetical protein